jgi:hypothetical protein
MKKNHLDLDLYESLDHDERNEVLCEFSIGCIEYGQSTFIEVLKITSLTEECRTIYPDNHHNCFFLFLDHNDSSEDKPFQTLSEVSKNYEFTRNELREQIKYTKEGHLKMILRYLRDSIK